MKIKPIVYGILVLSVFFGIILVFQAAGMWSTSGKFKPNGEAIQPSVSDPATIKGWMTLEQIVTTFGIPLSDILTEFNLPDTTLISTPLKDLESDTFDTSALIEWLQFRSMPSSIPSTTPEVILTITTTAPNQEATELISDATPSTTEHIGPEKTITGKTTFQEVLDWGVTIDSIQLILDSPIPNTGLIIKDYASSNGLAFSDIKAKLQLEVDKYK
ncbi:hypothetical protein EG832_10475 [bacterium]|nr:hypothetical protein [bacterium]